MRFIVLFCFLFFHSIFCFGVDDTENAVAKPASETRTCNPDLKAAECKSKQRQCSEDFSKHGFTQPADSLLHCQVSDQCHGIQWGQHAYQCLQGVGVSLMQVVEFGKGVISTTRDVFTGEAYRKWVAELEAEHERLKPYYVRVKAVCGEDPTQSEEYYQHRILYSQNKINAFKFENGEIRLTRATREYQICEIRTLDSSGAYDHNKKLVELLTTQLKLAGVKFDCYSSVYKTKLICELATYIVGGAAGTLAAQRFLQMTGVALKSMRATRLANYQRKVSGKFDELLSTSPTRTVPHGHAQPFRMGVDGRNYTIIPSAEGRAWALERGLIQEFTKDQVGNIKLKPGHYNFTVLKDGRFVVGQVDDVTEFGVRHVNLANDRPVIAGGQIQVRRNGTYEFNLGSGTYSEALTVGWGNAATYQANVSVLLESYMGNTGVGKSFLNRIVPDKFPDPKKVMSMCRTVTFQVSNKAHCCELYSLGCH